MSNSHQNVVELHLPQDPPSEQEIIKSWGSETKPKVSICCATYNHVNYIDDAIRGFLSQKTNFPFEIIIRDDASNDGTIDIIKEYARRYPKIIRLVIYKENQYQKGKKWLEEWPELMMGEYYASCEGDDFWICPHKLQKQLDLLEKYPEAVMSVALTHFFQQENDSLRYLRTTQPCDKVLLNVKDVHTNYFHTSTYLIRGNVFKDVIDSYFTGTTLLGDTALRAILIAKGSFVLLPEVVSVYRIDGAGIWTSLDKEKQLRWEEASTKRLLEILSDDHREYQRRHMVNILLSRAYLLLKNWKIVSAVKIIPVVLWYDPFTLFKIMRRKFKS